MKRTVEGEGAEGSSWPTTNAAQNSRDGGPSCLEARLRGEEDLGGEHRACEDECKLRKQRVGHLVQAGLSHHVLPSK